MDRSKFSLRFIGIFLVLLLLSLAYLKPGPSYMLKGDKTQVMSDGTDVVPAPFVYGIILEHAKKDPLSLLSGAVPTDQKNAPEGAVLWVPWMEKIFVVLSGPFFALEQLTTAYALFLMLLNALSFYLMGRTMQWSRPLSLSGSIAFAFSAYARARAKVHIGLMGIFHLPLIFLAFYLLQKKDDKKSTALAALFFFVASLTNHYYLIAMAMFSPLYMLYILLNKEDRLSTTKIFRRTIIAALPAICLTLYSYKVPYFKNSTIKTQNIYAEQSKIKKSDIHPFLERYSSHLIDFFTGDIQIGKEADINPLRAGLNRYVSSHLKESNSHERTNGIRWVVWAIFFWGAFFLVRKKDLLEKEQRRSLFFFMSMALIALLLSLGPVLFGQNIGPVLFIHHVLPQFRVTSRLGVEVQFAVLLFSLTYLNWWLHKYKNKFATFLQLSWALPLIMVLDFPPFLNDMPVSAILPQKVMVEKKGQPCGTGLMFPYTSDTWSLLDFYYLEQTLRGTDCKIIGNSIVDKKEKFLVEHFGLHDLTIGKILRTDPKLMSDFVKTTKCLDIDWIVFNRRMPEGWIKNYCSQMGYIQSESSVCRKKEIKKTEAKDSTECFNETK